MSIFRINNFRNFVILCMAICAQTFCSADEHKPEVKVLKGVKVIEGKWGDGPGEFGIEWNELGLPFGPFPATVVDKEGNIYVGDDVNHRVQKFSKDGKYLLSLGGKRGEDSWIYGILGLVADGNGNVYVGQSKFIQVFDKNSGFKKIIPLDSTIQLAILWGQDEKGNFLISDEGKSHLVAQDGEVIRSHDKDFIPLGEKDYYFYYDKIEGTNKLVTVKGREKSELAVKTVTNISRRRSFPFWLSPEGYFIIIARGSGSSYKDKIILYINQQGETMREYIISYKDGDRGTPILGLNGNFYRIGYKQEENNPSYGGFWVKRYTIPPE